MAGHTKLKRAAGRLIKARRSAEEHQDAVRSAISECHQSKLAEQIGVSSALLSDICKGKRNITNAVAVRLAELAAACRN